MNKDNRKNVLVLRNNNSKVFEEVIFVLKKDATIRNTKKINLVDEAKKIVDDYINRANSFLKKDETIYNEIKVELNSIERNKRVNFLLNSALGVSILLFGAMLFNIIH